MLPIQQTTKCRRNLVKALLWWDKGEEERAMGHVTRLLINPSSSSPLLHLRCCHRTLDPNSVFSLRTSITKSKGRFSCLFSGGNQREVSFLTYFP